MMTTGYHWTCDLTTLILTSAVVGDFVFITYYKGDVNIEDDDLEDDDDGENADDNLDEFADDNLDEFNDDTNVPNNLDEKGT